MRAFEHFPNLVTMFFTRAGEEGEKPFLWHKDGGAWHSLSWAEVARQVAALSAALRAEGVRPGDRVMLVSENRPEFCIADLAIMAAGAVTVPTYTTNTTRDHEHILGDSGARAVIVSTARLAKPLMPAVLRSNARLVIGIEPLRIGQEGAVGLRQWDTLIAAHGADPDADPKKCAARQTATREGLACIIYTSGTGGAPRGVMQHHGAILHNVEACVEVIAQDFGWAEEAFLSFLPLSHAYEHSAGQFFPIGLAAQIYYAEGLDRLAELPQQACHEEEAEATRQDGRPHEREQVEMRGARSDGHQLVGDRRQALDQDEPGPVLLEPGAKGGKAGLEPVGLHHPGAQRLEEVVADGVT